MAILQCLNCGRSNPDFLDNCQYCGKALKPGAKTEPLGSDSEGLESGTKPFGQQINIPPEDLDIPEWLRNTGDLPPLKTEPEGSVPAWLKAATDELKPLPAENAPVPDWLKAASKPLVEPSPEPEASDMPDWLKAMGASATGPLEAEAEKPAMTGDDDMPDWLKAATGPLDEERPATASGDMPDWLMNATGKLPAAEPPGGEGTGPISITGPIEEEVPDWLKSMGATGPMAAPTVSTAGEATGPIQEDVPDWLRGMSGSIGGTAPFAIPATPEPTSVSGEITGPIQEEMPDWLKSMGGSGGTNPLAVPAAPEPEPASDLPDWLMNATGQLPHTSVVSPPSSEVTGPITGPIQEDMPDWLKSMGGTNPLATPATPEPEPAVDMPDWLINATGQLPATPLAEPLGGEGTGPITITGPIEEEVPDWLQAMGATGSIATPAAAEPISAETPDWLAGNLGGTAPFALPATEPAAEELQAEETPDWLKAATGELPVEPAIFTPSEPAVPVQPATPDWLRGTGELGGTAPFAAPESTPPAEGADLPDWLRTATGMLPGALAAALPDPTPAQPETPQPPPGIHTGELPDWLKTATGPLDKPPAPVNTGELPDWLKSATGPLTPPTDVPPTPAAGELPDWLRSSTGPLTPAVEAAPEISQAPQPDWLSELEKSGDDLGLIGAGVVAEDITLGAEATPPATPASDEPDWLRALQSGAPAEAVPGEPVASEPNWLSNLRGEPEIAETPAASSGDEPDWMAALRPTPKAEPQSTYNPPAELTQGELPNWLSALRPVDAGTHLEAEQDTYQETVGVLSGMRGVLRAEPSVVLPGKTATQVHALDVTAEQNQQAAAFLQLLQADTETTSTAPKKRLSVPWLRWLVTALLLLAVAARLIFPEQLNGFFPSPTTQKTISAEVADTWGTIESLSVSKPVLMAFDYEPGQQGEVGLLAESVTSHLIRRGLRLVAVSTSPTGAAVGQELLTKLANMPTLQPQPYIEANHYLNLGYLPGGPIGIAQFARSPEDFVRRDFRGNAEETLVVNEVAQIIKIWDLPLLNSVTSITDFGALIVLTASPENARQWFEQTEVLRNSVEPRVPIIFVTSASAAPLVRPYYELERGATGNARAGLVSGPTAILEYEAKAGTAAELNFTYWDMVGYGTVLAGLLLVIGNLVYGLRQLWRQQRWKAA